MGPRATHVYDELRARILGGTFALGARLPSQDALAAELSVALLTVRQAIVRLEDEGLVSSEQGRGTFVRAHRSTAEMAERSFRALIHAAPLAIFSLDAAGNVRSWNRACEDMFGWTEAEVLGKFPPQIQPEDCERVLPFLDRVRAEGPITGLSGIGLTRAGKTIHLRSSTAPLYDGDGYMIGTISIVDDISEWKRMEDALQASEERFRSLVEASPAGISYIDLAGNIVTANAALAVLLGYDSPDELVGRNVLAAVPPEDRTSVRSRLQGPGVPLYESEYTLLRADGSTFIAEIRRAVISGADGQPIGFVAFTWDVTERKRLEGEMLRLTEQARADAAEAQLMAERLSALQDVTAGLSTALTSDDVAQVVLQRGIASVHADAGVVALLAPAGDELRIVRMAGYSAQRLEPVPLTSNLPLASCVRTGKPVWVESWEEFFAATEGIPSPGALENSAAAALPLLVDGRPIGAVGLSFRAARTFSVAERGFMLSLVDQCAQALDRARIYELERQECAARDAIIAASPYPIVTLDPNGLVTSWTPAAERLLGYSADEVLGRRPPSIPPDDWPRFEEVLEKARRGVCVSDVSIVKQRKDGTTLDIMLSMEPLFDTEGRSQGCVVVMIDVTDHNRYAQELRRSEESFRNAFEAASIGMAINEVGGGYKIVNDALCRITGYTRDELLQRRFVDITHPDDVDLDLAQQDRLLAGEAPYYHLEKRYIHKDGRTIWVLLTCTLVRDADLNRSYFVAQIQDITAVKTAEDALRANEELLRLTVEQAGVGIVLADGQGRIVQCNPALAEMLGYSPEELIGSSYANLTYPDDLDLDAAYAARLLAGEIGQYEMNKRYIHRDGSVRWGHLNVSVLRTPDGNPQYALAMVDDLTDRMMAEEALRSSQERLQAIYEHSPLAIGIADTDGRIVGVNRKYEELLGYTRDDLIGRTYMELTHPDDQDEDLALLRDLVEGRRASYVVEKRYRHRDGHDVWVSVKVALLREADGRPAGPIAIIEDISERRQIAEALRISEERYRTIVETAGEGIWQIDAEGRTTYVNRRMADMLGFTVGEMMNRSCFDFMDDAGRDLAATRVERRRQGISEDHECKFLHKDGRAVWVRLSTHPLLNADGVYAGALAMATDVTERRRWEEEQARLAAIVESSQDSMLSLTLDGVITSWNRGAEILYGYTPDEALGQFIGFVFPPDHANDPMARLRRVAQGESVGPFESARRRKNGTVIAVEVTLSPIRNAAGTIIGASSCARDISERKAMEQALRQSEEQYRSVIETSPDVVCLTDLEGRLLMVNDGAAEIMGYPPHDAVGMSVLDMVAPQDRVRAAENMRQRRALETLQGRNVEYTLIRRDGSAFPAEVSSTVVLGDDGWPTSLTIVARDITERKESEERLRQQLEFTAAITDSMGEGVLAVDDDFRLTFLNRAGEEILGWTEEELLGKEIHGMIHSQREDGSPLPADECPLLRVARGSEPYRSERDVFIRRDGTMVPVSYSSAPLVRDGATAGVVVAFRDISERLRLEQQIQHRSLHDTLTGLPNRSLLHQQVEETVTHAQRDSQPIALLFVDLDRFKELNDSLSHHHGDLLLQRAGCRLQEIAGGLDTVARLGDDEFAILAPVHDEAGAMDLVNRVAETFKRPFDLDGHTVYVDASIGVALYPDLCSNAVDLMRRADVAVYLAKRAGSGYAFYSPEHDVNKPDRIQLIAELREAIERRELILYYQPKIDLKKGELVGVEGLVRWPHATRGVVPPNDFIPLAEQTGLIKPLTLLVLEAAAEQACRWRACGLDIPIAINLSARSFQDPNLVESVERILAGWRIQPGWLGVEVTETAVMADLDRAQQILADLRSMGLTIFIDDFGVGHSSLAYLKRLPADEIKIDRSFVKDMLTEHDDAFIVRSVIDLGHHRGLRVSAEGVETQQVMDILAVLGCDVIQGYYISRPLPADDLDRWLAEFTAERRAS